LLVHHVAVHRHEHEESVARSIARSNASNVSDLTL
jgi:hypothetical protein